MRACPPLTQPERLRALHSFGIMDTPREADFDEIVDFTAKLCDVPIAVINLLDADRQWFKAEVGLDVDHTPLETSICYHALNAGRFLEIPDTLLDSRTADCPLCHGDNAIRFYAGAVIRDEKGAALGTLCVLDRRPRHLTQLQRDGLRLLADQVVRQMQLRRALRDQKFLQKEMDHRVRNSLMTVAALLRVERQSVTSEEARVSLAAAERRIRAVAQVHQELYTNAASLDQVELAPFIGRLSEQMREVLPKGVQLCTDLTPIWLKVQSASALAMIFCEFVANSGKHAFPGDRPGRIEVIGRTKVAEGGAGKIYQMIVRDNGVGLFQKDADLADGPGLSNGVDSKAGIGLKIIEAAASQLDGSYTITNGGIPEGGANGDPHHPNAKSIGTVHHTRDTGTTLTVTLPIEAGEVANAPVTPHVPAAQIKPLPRILTQQV